MLFTDGEILHGLNSFVESDWVLDADDSRVERSGDVLSDLGFGVEKDSSHIFESDGNLS